MWMWIGVVNLPGGVAQTRARKMVIAEKMYIALKIKDKVRSGSVN